MSRLRIFSAEDPVSVVRECLAHAAIVDALNHAGVRFERRPLRHGGARMSADETMALYREDIAALQSEEGYAWCDVVAVTPEHPQRAELRNRFLQEHTHVEDEVRFFVAGRGLFSLHLGTEVYEILCEAGDLISVAKGTRHWFDMGSNPMFTAVRFFSDPSGWVAHFTGSEIAAGFPRYDN